MKNPNKPKIKQPRVTELTQNKIEAYLERRAFEGKYVSYITARQFSSAGNASSEQLGADSGRHEYFSDLERRFGITLSYLKNVSAVKTQYPLLDVDTTLSVASRLNIPHPRFAPKRGLVKEENQGYQAAIMTTDFLFQYADVITGEIKKIAVSLKYDDDIVVKDDSNRVIARTQDKLEIERTYWIEERKAEFKLITSSHWTVGSIFVNNIDTARRFRDLDIPHGILRASQIAFLEELQRSPRYRLADLVHKVSTRTVISFEKTFAIFWYLIWHKGLQLDLFRPLNDASFVFPAREDFAWAW
ncbi:TnsA endonuclease N-terminal domain-containing protein [Aliidiomarina indica]|uniref:TnsA endonuclease N-terminal domain-containing protein n=1 Tax=Aliidiomarina indica TaxID=2749147 RepID=UPI00188F1E90|nr:TnsA endonuclease N-terminal domain-containing protein [Aliidiomarina indica]